MSVPSGLPPPNHPIAGNQSADRRWYDWARRIDRILSSAGISVSSFGDTFKALAKKLGSPDGSIENIPDNSGSQQKIVGTDGVNVLQNEEDRFVQISLEDLPDTGGGVLQKFIRDLKGRVSGTSAANTSDLPEGGNLYYTNERADSRVAVHETKPDPHSQYFTRVEAANKYDKTGGKISGKVDIDNNTSGFDINPTLYLRCRDGNFIKIFLKLGYANYSTLVQENDAALIFSSSDTMYDSASGFVFAPWSSTDYGFRIHSGGQFNFSCASLLFAKKYKADSSSISPISDNQQSLGSQFNRWASAYFNKLVLGSSFLTSGPGSPEGSIVAPVGSIYTRTDGGLGSTLYVKESGAGNTGWSAK